MQFVVVYRDNQIVIFPLNTNVQLLTIGNRMGASKIKD